MYDSVSMYVCMHTFMDGCLSMYVCLYVYGHTSAYLSADLSIFLCFRLIYTVAIADVYMCTPVSTIFISAYVRVIIKDIALQIVGLGRGFSTSLGFRPARRSR